MPLDSLLRQSATFPRRNATGPDDAHGNPTIVDEVDDGVACYYEQTAPTEITIGRDTQIADGLLILPAGTEVSGDDEVVIAGTTHTIIGPPWSVFDPTTATVSHIECRTRSLVG